MMLQELLDDGLWPVEIDDLKIAVGARFHKRTAVETQQRWDEAVSRHPPKKTYRDPDPGRQAVSVTDQVERRPYVVVAWPPLDHVAGSAGQKDVGKDPIGRPAMN
jgi:hypothetical protein